MKYGGLRRSKISNQDRGLGLGTGKTVLVNQLHNPLSPRLFRGWSPAVVVPAERESFSNKTEESRFVNRVVNRVMTAFRLLILSN